MDDGAALRAKAISASRSIKYFSIGAMLGWGFLASCACAFRAVPTERGSAKAHDAIILRVSRFIRFSPRILSMQLFAIPN
jgi:hypothetical protein